MAEEWLGRCELRRLNAFQPWQRLTALELKFDPAFQYLAQRLRRFVSRFSISPSAGELP
jgi:hypothetical protein